MKGRACGPVVERLLDGARLTLPPAARGLFSRQAALCADVGGCVLITPPEVWRTLLPALQECSAHNHQAAELFRLFAASETVVSIDGRGRLSLPLLHLQWAGLTPDRGAVVVVAGQRVEVWEPRHLAVAIESANRRLRDLDAQVLREQLALFGE